LPAILEVSPPKLYIYLYVVVYLLKARTVEQPEKQPLLVNGSETTFVSRQQLQNKQQNNVHYQAADS
jgi:hypothetical protein